MSIYQTKDWKKTSKEMLKDSNCIICNSKDNLIVHHKIKIKDGGSNKKENLTVLCKKCHAKLHRLEEFYSNNHAKKDFNYLKKELMRKI